MRLSEFRSLIREEVKNVINEQSINEDLALVGNVALGVAGGLVGLWAALKGGQFLKNVAGNVAYELGKHLEKKAAIAARESKKATIAAIAKKFDNDTELHDMYQNLTPYSPKTASKRTKELNQIAKYIKSKLTPEEMKYFTDISSMLRTGDIK